MFQLLFDEAGSFFGFLLVGIVALGLASVPAARGQVDSTEAWHEQAWTHIVRQQGVSISYIFYPRADNEHNGIVLRLENERDTSIRYAFTLIFRAPEADTTTFVRGTLRPGEMKTGEPSGLFWMPFRKEGYSVGEIGLRGLTIEPFNDARSSTPRSGSLVEEAGECSLETRLDPENSKTVLASLAYS